jgi:hypothetical protein
MTHLRSGLAAFTLLLGTLAAPAWAASSASSAASDSATTSVGSVSGSLRNSSDASSKTDTVADGDYKIIEVAALTGQPGTMRITLQALATPGADGQFFLDLPAIAAEQGALAAGGTVTARQRPYGIEFANGPQRQAFFLVLADEWFRELHSTPVSL